MNFMDPAMDDKIRAALKSADAKGEFSTAAAVAGISEESLREIMESEGELSIMDRGMLSIHLMGIAE